MRIAKYYKKKVLELCNRSDNHYAKVANFLNIEAAILCFDFNVLAAWYIHKNYFSITLFFITLSIEFKK